MKKFTFLFSLLFISGLAFASGPTMLFVGTGDFEPGGDNDVFEVDPNSGGSNNMFTADVWGMTSDNANQQVYFTSNDGTSAQAGANLWVYDLATGTPVQLGVITAGGADLRIDGLAISGGVLYGVCQFDTGPNASGIYSIDLTTFAGTFVLATPNGAVSGIDADPVTGIIYGVDDINGQIVQYDLVGGTTTTVAPYPAGYDDVDGLAADDQGNLYLVTDDPSEDIQIYNLTAATYTGTLSSPFTTADVFSGGAAFVCAGITLVPTMTEWGLFLFGLAMLTLGLVFVYNKQRQFA